MTVITTTVQTNEKNMREISTQKGPRNVLSVPIIKGTDGKLVYASTFLPDFVNMGDIVTVSGRIEQRESGKYLNNQFSFPTVERVFVNDNQPQAQANPFGGTEVEVDSDDLPF